MPRNSKPETSADLKEQQLKKEQEQVKQRLLFLYERYDKATDSEKKQLIQEIHEVQGDCIDKGFLPPVQPM